MSGPHGRGPRPSPYTVLEAELPERALEIVASTNAAIHLLVSDVVMPAMNGIELRENILALRPGIKTLLISGYSPEVMAQYGNLGPGSTVLEKPFSTEALGLRMRELLDRT